MLKLRVINNGDHAGLMWFPATARRSLAVSGSASSAS